MVIRKVIPLVDDVCVPSTAPAKVRRLVRMFAENLGADFEVSSTPYIMCDRRAVRALRLLLRSNGWRAKVAPII